MLVFASASAPGWFFVVWWLELVFVSCFFATEVVRFVLRRRIGQRERLSDVVSTDRYLDRFFRPMAAVIVSVPVAVGIEHLTNDDASPLVQYAGLVLVVVSLVVVGNYLHRDTTGTFPRPRPRARLRRALAHAEEVLASPTPSAPTELLRLRARLRRIGGVGVRLERRARSMGWREVVGQERRWFAAAVIVAALLPLVTLLWGLADAMRAGEPMEASAAGVLVGSIAATVTGAILRSVRYRRDLCELGIELRTTSERLLARLPQVDPSPSPSPRPARRRRSLLGDVLRRWRGRGQPA